MPVTGACTAAPPYQGDVSDWRDVEATGAPNATETGTPARPDNRALTCDADADDAFDFIVAALEVADAGW